MSSLPSTVYRALNEKASRSVSFEVLEIQLGFMISERQVTATRNVLHQTMSGGIKNQVQRLKKLVDARCFSSAF
jgi:hypothetical protein